MNEEDDIPPLDEAERKRPLSPREKALADSIRKRVTEALVEEKLAAHRALRSAFVRSRETSDRGGNS